MRLGPGKITDKLLESADFSDFERKFILSTSLVVALSAFFGTFLNLLLDFERDVIWVAASTFLVYMGLYLYGKHSGKIETLKWLISVVSLILINVFWALNYNSRGPVLYLFVVYFSLLLFIWNRRQLIILFFLVLVNILALFVIEYLHTHSLPSYPTERARLIDVYTGLIIYFSIIFIFTTAARNNYIRQYRKARESDQLKSSFLSNLSHEIRTPMNAIHGISSLLAAEDFSREEIRNHTRLIRDNSQYLTRLIEDVIDISKIETDQFSVKPEKAHLKSIFKQLAITFQSDIENRQKDLDLIMDIPEQEITLHTDVTRLEQTMQKLMSNAIKFTSRGSIRFGYTEKAGCIKFFVKDTGIGIREKDLSRVFERFVKIENDPDHIHRGTGIGLFMARQIVHFLKGEIWLESKFGKGTSVYFTLPR
jgi:signal transduction histidine kinase